MDMIIAGVILIAVMVGSSSQAVLDGVSLEPTEPVAAVESSPEPENVASECEGGRPLIITRDLTVRASPGAPAHGS